MRPRMRRAVASVSADDNMHSDAQIARAYADNNRAASRRLSTASIVFSTALSWPMRLSASSAIGKHFNKSGAQGSPPSVQYALPAKKIKRLIRMAAS